MKDHTPLKMFVSLVFAALFAAALAWGPGAGAREKSDLVAFMRAL